MTATVKIFVVLFCSFGFAMSRFRCDYTYFPDAGGWYKLHLTPAQWHLAKQICEHEGSELVQVSTKAMQSVMMQLMEEQSLTIPVHTGIRVFIPLDIDNADPQHLLDNMIPENKKAIVKEQVLIMWRNGTLEQTDTFMWYPYICHMSAGETVHLNKCGTLDDEYILDHRTDHCYKFHRMRNTWHNALLICGAEGGTLSVINSELEAEVIKDIFSKNPSDSIPGETWVDSAFLGYSLSQDMIWITTNGLTLPKSGYEAWSPGEPNNARGDEFCGSVGRNGLLFDDPCSRELPFICEMERESLLNCNKEKMREDTEVLLRSMLKGRDI